MLDLGIDLDIWPWIWLTVAVVFALFELTLIAGTFVLAPFAISAFAASIAGFYDASVEVQWVVFGAGGGALFFVFYRWAHRFVSTLDLPPGVGADRLVGMIGITLTDVPARHSPGTGRVAVEGETWSAVAESDAVVPAGTTVSILSVTGTRVVVRRVPTPTDPATPEVEL